MLKRLLLFFIIIFLTMFILLKKQTSIPVFLEDGEYTYHFYYDNLTTNNIIDELSYLSNYDVDIYINAVVENKNIDYVFNSKSMKMKLGEFFNYCLSLLDEEDVNKAYIKGIKVSDVIVRMPSNIANEYLSTKKELKYRIFE